MLLREKEKVSTMSQNWNTHNTTQNTQILLKHISIKKEKKIIK